MRSRSAALLVTVVCLGAAAPAASAAEVRVDKPCFADPTDRKDTVTLTGSGFDPDADYQVTLDGLPLTGGTGRTDAAGNLSGRFVAPGVRTVAPRARQHRFRLRVQQGANQPETTFGVSRLAASFAPTRGDLTSLRVRFSVWGFGLERVGAPEPVYVHYVGPTGRLARSVRLGSTRGDCGFLRTARRRLFAFTPRSGRWRLQFDSRRRYTRGTPRSDFLFTSVGVRVR